MLKNEQMREKKIANKRQGEKNEIYCSRKAKDNHQKPGQLRGWQTKRETTTLLHADLETFSSTALPYPKIYGTEITHDPVPFSDAQGIF